MTSKRPIILTVISWLAVVCACVRVWSNGTMLSSSFYRGVLDQSRHGWVDVLFSLAFAICIGIAGIMVLKRVRLGIYLIELAALWYAAIHIWTLTRLAYFSYVHDLFQHLGFSLAVNIVWIAISLAVVVVARSNSTRAYCRS